MKMRYPVIALITALLTGAISSKIMTKTLTADIAINIIQIVCIITMLVSLCLIIYIIIKFILTGTKNFIFELIDRIKRPVESVEHKSTHHTENPEPFTQADFERWKAKRLAEQQEEP